MIIHTNLEDIEKKWQSSLKDLAKYGYKPDIKYNYFSINSRYLWLHTENQMFFDVLRTTVSTLENHPNNQQGFFLPVHHRWVCLQHCTISLWRIKSLPTSLVSEIKFQVLLLVFLELIVNHLYNIGCGAICTHNVQTQNKNSNCAENTI